MDLMEQLMGHTFSQAEACLLVMLCGGTFLFFGVRLYRIFAVFTGMVVGGMLGSMVAEIVAVKFPHMVPDVFKYYHVLLPVIGAILCGAVAVSMSRMALSILIGAGAFYIAFKIGLDWGPMTGLVSGAIAYLVFAFLASQYFNQIIILASSFFGVIIALVGVMNFLAISRNEVFLRLMVNYRLTILAVAAVFFVIGMFYQFDLERHSRSAQAG